MSITTTYLTPPKPLPAVSQLAELRRRLARHTKKSQFLTYCRLALLSQIFNNNKVTSTKEPEKEHTSIYCRNWSFCMSSNRLPQSRNSPEPKKLIKLGCARSDDAVASDGDGGDDEDAAEAQQAPVDMRTLSTRGKWLHLVAILKKLNKVRSYTKKGVCLPHECRASHLGLYYLAFFRELHGLGHTRGPEG